MIHTVIVTFLYRRRATRHCHVFNAETIVSSPACVSTVSYRSLVADTLYVVQQDRSSAWPVPIDYYFSFVPAINGHQVQTDDLFIIILTTTKLHLVFI